MELNATFLASIISFIVFVFIMNAVFYRPLAKIVEERKNFVDKNYEDAKKANKKSEQIMTDIEQKRSDTLLEAKTIIQGKSDKAKKEKDEMTQEARKKSFDEIAEAKRILEEENQNSKNALNNDINNLADIICSKLDGNS